MAPMSRWTLDCAARSSWSAKVGSGTIFHPRLQQKRCQSCESARGRSSLARLLGSRFLSTWFRIYDANCLSYGKRHWAVSSSFVSLAFLVSSCCVPTIPRDTFLRTALPGIETSTNASRPLVASISARVHSPPARSVADIHRCPLTTGRLTVHRGPASPLCRYIHMYSVHTYDVHVYTILHCPPHRTGCPCFDAATSTGILVESRQAHPNRIAALHENCPAGHGTLST